MPDERKRFVIIGNGVAGTTAAETIRRQSSSAVITIVAAEPYPLYNRVALPRFLKGEVNEQRVIMRDFKDHEKRAIKVLSGLSAIRVDTNDREVVLEDGRKLPYDALLIATGGTPRPLDVPGGDAVGLFPFQTLDDTKALIEAAKRARNAVALGGSYIAYELAEAFRVRGLHVTWLIRGSRFLHRVLDEEGGELVDRIARRHGVNILYHDEVVKVRQRDGVVTGIVTKRGRSLDCDMIGTGLGLELNTRLLAGSGVRVRRGVVADARLRTNVSDVYAAGDVAEFYDTFLGAHNVMGTWNNAHGHGKVAGLNMTGAGRVYTDVPHYTTTMFNSSMTVIGMTTEIDPDLDAVAHADFATETYRRLFFDDGRRLVGAVLIGDLGPRRMLAQMIRSRERVADREALLGTVLARS